MSETNENQDQVLDDAETKELERIAQESEKSQEGEVQPEETQDDGISPGERAIIEKLKETSSNAKEAELIAKLTADPDMRRVMEARQTGKKVQVMTEDELEKMRAPKEVEEPEDMENLPPAKLVDFMLKKVGESVSAQIDKALSPILSKIEAVENAHLNQERGKVDEQIKKAQEKYTDFQTYVGDMKEISKGAPALTVEELYILAKRRAGGFKKTSPKVSSEHPTRTSTRPPRTQDSVEQRPRETGRGEFRNFLSEALEKIKLPQSLDEIMRNSEG